YRQHFVPWVDYHPIARALDPNFAYYQHLHAGREGWETSLRELYRGRLAGEIARPPRTLNQQHENIKGFSAKETGNANIHKNVNLTNVQSATGLVPLKSIHDAKVTHLGSLGQGKESKSNFTTLKTQPVPKAEHLREQQAANQIHQAGNVRRESEANMLLK